MDEQTQRIRDRLDDVRRRIGEAAHRSGRSPEDVRLVVVTKGHPVETIRRAIEAGAELLGENYVEEALPKIEALAWLKPVWHMIGHVQSRKAQLVAANFAFVHSVDRVKLARKLAEAFQGSNPLSVLLQVNISGESGKSGAPGWDERDWPAIFELVGQIRRFSKIRLCGLMTIPPDLPGEQARPYFRRLIQLRDAICSQSPGFSLNELSMGMSGDFEAAVEEGATMVRVGTAILGQRPLKE